jgi:hypothetical protein
MNIHVYYGAKHLLYNVIKSQILKNLTLTSIIYDICLVPYATFIHFKKKVSFKGLLPIWEHLLCTPLFQSLKIVDKISWNNNYVLWTVGFVWILIWWSCITM